MLPDKGMAGITQKKSEERAFGEAKFGIGQIVRHRLHSFRGVVFDIDPVFSSSDEWYEAIPVEHRPPKGQPFYHLFAQNPEDGAYEAYVSEQNLISDDENGPVQHPMIDTTFEGLSDGRYQLPPSRWQ